MKKPGVAAEIRRCPGIVDRHVEFEGFRVHALVALDHVQLIRVRALLGARAITGVGSTWSPRNNTL